MTTDLKRELSELLKENEEYENPNGVGFCVQGLELSLSVEHPCREGEQLVLYTRGYFPEEIFEQFKLKTIEDLDALHPRALWSKYKAGKAMVNVVAGPNATSLLFSIKEGTTFVAEYGGDHHAVLEQKLGNGNSILAYARKYR